MGEARYAVDQLPGLSVAEPLYHSKVKRLVAQRKMVRANARTSVISLRAHSCVRILVMKINSGSIGG